MKKQFTKTLPYIILLLFSSFSIISKAQLMNHYWSLNFNSQSSLLSGAVVAGDGGNTSIYFNPSTISEIKNGSNLSFAASLFTWGIYHYTDALGSGIEMTNVSFNVQPQFLSFSYRPKNSKYAFAFSALTRMKERFDINYYNSEQIDIIKNKPGLEEYFTTYKYFLEYTDNWFGVAGSYDLSNKFKIGMSLFLSSSYISYRSATSAIAYSTTDTTWIGGDPNPSPVYEGSYSETFKFTDYRLIAKLGFTYVLDKWRFGLNITSPSISLFSSNKEAAREQRMTNITNPENNEFMPGYVIVNGLTKKDIKTRMKFPFSISFGFIREINNSENRLYFTAEYFSGISPYKMVDAPISENITSNIVYDQLKNKDWLSTVDVAKPVLNLAIGYKWVLTNELMFLSGFRTDFNNIKKADYEEYSNHNKVNTTDINIYHYTGGFQFHFLKKNVLVAGGELSFGYDKNQQQIANFTEPVEYTPSNSGSDPRILQGPLENKMDVYYFGFNIYISAVFKFGGIK